MASESTDSIINLTTHQIFYGGNIHIVLLGRLIEDEGSFRLILESQPSSTMTSLPLSSQQYIFLKSINPIAVKHIFSISEQALIIGLAGRGAVVFVSDDAPLSSLNMIVVPRLQVHVMEKLQDGFRFNVGTDEEFEVSELSYRFASHIDNIRTLGELAELTREEMMRVPEERASIEKHEREENRSFDTFLLDEAFFFIKDFVGSGAVSIEVKD